MGVIKLDRTALDLELRMRFCKRRVIVTATINTEHVTYDFLSVLGHKLAMYCGEVRSSEFLFQRISHLHCRAKDSTHVEDLSETWQAMSIRGSLKSVFTVNLWVLAIAMLSSRNSVCHKVMTRCFFPARVHGK